MFSKMHVFWQRNELYDLFVKVLFTMGEKNLLSCLRDLLWKEQMNGAVSHHQLFLQASVVFSNGG